MIYDKKTKDAMISEKMKELNKTFSKIDAKTKKSLQDLIKNAAFMAVTLQELQEVINEKGVTEEYQNGANQKGFKKSSEIEVYNTMIKNYSSVIKQLTDLLPKEGPATEDDGFEEFVGDK